MTTYRFDEISRTAKRRVPCTGGCGKKLNRQQTFTQTINPFNKNAQGQPKTSGEIWKELGVECDEWTPTAVCPACADEVKVREKARAAAWNNAYPSGTPIWYWPDEREGAGVESVTRGSAWATGGHSAVVFVEGYAYAVSLSHVVVLNGDEPETADAVAAA